MLPSDMSSEQKTKMLVITINFKLGMYINDQQVKIVDNL